MVELMCCLDARVVVDDENNIFFYFIKKQMTIVRWTPSNAIPWDYWIPTWPQGRVQNVIYYNRQPMGDPTIGYTPNRNWITPNYNTVNGWSYGRYGWYQQGNRYNNNYNYSNWYNWYNWRQGNRTYNRGSRRYGTKERLNKSEELHKIIQSMLNN